jgi:multiple sugar transport system substrate-binding protein
MAVSLAACAGPGAGAGAAAEGPAPGVAAGVEAAAAAAADPDVPRDDVLVVFWDMMTGSDRYPIVAAEHSQAITNDLPHITIEYQSIPWANRLEMFTTALAAGTGPDFSNGGGYQSFQFYAMGEIMDITPIIDWWREDGTLQLYDYEMIQYFRVGDSQVGIPIGYEARMWLYRTDWFEEAGMSAPTTWEELYEAAVHFTDPAAGTFGLTYPTALSGGNVLFFSWFASNGGGVWTNDGSEPDWAKPENVEVVEFIRRLNDAGVFPPGMSAYDAPEMIQAAVADTSAMLIITAGGAGIDIARSHGDVFSFFPAPAGPSANGRSGSVMSMNGYMAYSNTDHPLETMEALRWWADNWYILVFNPDLAVSSIPPRSDWRQDERYLTTMGDPFLRQWVVAGEMASVHTLVSPAPNISCWLTQNAFDAERWWTRLSQAVLTTDTPAAELLGEFQQQGMDVFRDFQGF